MTMEKTKNQTEQIQNDDLDFLKTQNEITIIDIQDQAEKKVEKNKYKHVYIYKQFLIPKVYTTALLIYIIFFVCNVACNIIMNSILGPAEDNTSTNQDKLVERLNNNKKSMIFFIIYACIGAPIIEEFIFRSIIFKIINWAGKKVQEKQKFIGIIIRILAFLISSFIFAFAHFNLSFEVLIKEIRTFPTYFIMGLAFAFAYNRDNYLLASILTHSLNNIIAVVVILFFSGNEMVTNTNNSIFFDFKFNSLKYFI